MNWNDFNFDEAELFVDSAIKGIGNIKNCWKWLASVGMLCCAWERILDEA